MREKDRTVARMTVRIITVRSYFATESDGREDAEIGGRRKDGGCSAARSATSNKPSEWSGKESTARSSPVSHWEYDVVPVG